MNLAWTASVGNIITAITLALTIVIAVTGLNQWRSDTTVRLIDEYGSVDTSHARTALRKLVREVGPEADWRDVFAKGLESDRDRLSFTIGVLNRYYNRVGLLLAHRNIIRGMILPVLATDVRIFEAPLRAWMQVTGERREADLALVGKSVSKEVEYWKGTKALIRSLTHSRYWV